MKKHLFTFVLLFIVYYVGLCQTDISGRECVMYFLLMGLITKDYLKELCYVLIGEEVE